MCLSGCRLSSGYLNLQNPFFTEQFLSLRLMLFFSVFLYLENVGYFSSLLRNMSEIIKNYDAQNFSVIYLGTVVSESLNFLTFLYCFWISA